MQYTVRTFVGGRDGRIDEIFRVFCFMEKAAYNLLRDDVKASEVKHILRERYGIRNTRWIQSAINQAGAVMASQEEGITYRIELCSEKVKNTREKMKSLFNPIKIAGCKAKIAKYESRIKELQEQLREKSYPRAVFWSKKLFHQMATADGQRYQKLKEKWKEKKSNHFFSVGQANLRGNGNTRFTFENDGRFFLEIRN